MAWFESTFRGVFNDFLFLCTFVDECFEVEQQCQHLISEIERVLGEPLQKYF